MTILLIFNKNIHFINFITFNLCPLPDSASKFSPKRDASRSLAPLAPTFVPETGHFESLGYFDVHLFLQTGRFASLGTTGA